MEQDKGNDIGQIFDQILALEADQLGKFNNDDLAKIIELFWLFYSENGRHYYYQVTEYIISINRTSQEDIVKIATIVKLLIEKMSECCEMEKSIHNCHKLEGNECQYIKEFSDILLCYNCKELSRSLNKIYDHIQLEIKRLTEIERRNKELEGITGRLKAQLEENIKKQEELKKYFRDSLESNDKYIERKIFRLTKKVEGETKNIYLQVVSILGIFTAVVVAIFGGLKVFDSAISSFSSLPKLTFVFSAGMFILFNMVFILLWFIAKMYLRTRLPDKIWDLCSGVNLVCVLLIFISLTLLCN